MLLRTGSFHFALTGEEKAFTIQYKLLNLRPVCIAHDMTLNTSVD
jgi:hypothetical protein